MNLDDTDPPPSTDQAFDTDPTLGERDSRPADERSPSGWSDLSAYVATPRLGELVLARDGTLLVSVASLDHTATAYRSSWWRVDPTGTVPARRLTRAVEGDSSAAFTPDGSLLFTSKRPVPAQSEDDSEDSGAIWCLPAGGGEAYVVARRDGGFSSITTARDSSIVLVGLTRHAGAADEAADAAQRKLRRTKKVSAILHEGYPVRYWDHDLGPEQMHLLIADLAGNDAANNPPDHAQDVAFDPAALREAVPDPDRHLGSPPRLSADGRYAVLTWNTPARGGETVSSVAVVETATSARDLLATAGEDSEFGGAVISDDGALVVCVRERRSTPETAPDQKLWLVERRSGAGRWLARDWDAWPDPVAISPDARTVYVRVDEDGQGPLYAVDLATGDRRRLTEDGAFSSVQLSADGATLYAVRSSYLDPGSIVAVSTADAVVSTTDGVSTARTTVLASPVEYPALPGRLEDVETTADDGTRVRGYLLLPDGASSEEPAPLLLWVHGGPLGSWNAWSWRWCPWLMVAQGYAVLLGDPALSTGYGLEFVQRGWGQWGAAPYTDLMSLTDAVEARSDIDETTTAAMGGSFGGYMANWIAGHTDRFDAIVTHASLWNLESFGPTTDASWFWARELSTTMQQEHSPHRFAEHITTPTLVVHGDKDYRVPISEGLALWWSLVSGFDGSPEEMPHKFLYYPDENHWILTPQHAIVWYETVLNFLTEHLRHGNFVRPPTL